MPVIFHDGQNTVMSGGMSGIWVPYSKPHTFGEMKVVEGPEQDIKWKNFQKNKQNKTKPNNNTIHAFLP